MPGKLWVEETGGIVVRRDATGRALLSFDEGRAERAMHGAFALARTRPRIERMYVYQWRAGADDLFDAGVVRPDGTARASYAAFAAGLRSLPKPVASPGDDLEDIVVARAHLLLRGTCSAAPCKGRVTIKLRSSRTFRTALRTTKTVGTRSVHHPDAAADGLGEGARRGCAPRGTPARLAHGPLQRARPSRARASCSSCPCRPYSSRNPIFSVTW